MSFNAYAILWAFACVGTAVLSAYTAQWLFAQGHNIFGAVQCALFALNAYMAVGWARRIQ